MIFRTPAQHDTASGLTAEKYALQIHVHHLIPIILRDVFRQHPLPDPRY